jgi:hypothetical protein
MSDAKKEKPCSDETRAKILSSQPHVKVIEVFDQVENETTIHDSISAAVRALNIKQQVISIYFYNNQQKLYKGRYIFTKVKEILACLVRSPDLLLKG